MEFREVDDYLKSMKEFYGIEENEEVRKGYEDFIKEREFVLDSSEDCEDSLLIIEDKYYWCIERNEGVKFIELSKEEIEDYWNE